MQAVSLEATLSIYVPALVLALGVGIALPAIPLLAESFHVSFAAASYIITVFLVGGMAGTLPTGWLIDRFGRNVALLGGPLLTSALALAVVLSRSFPQLLIFRFFDGWAGQMWLMGRMTGISATTSADQRARQITWMFGMDNTGKLIGPLVGGFIAAAWGPRAPFAAYSLLALLALIPSFMFSRDPKPAQTSIPIAASGEQVKASWQQLFFPRWPFFVLIFCSALARTPVFSGLLHLYAAFTYNLDATTIGYLAAVTGALNVPVGILAGYLSDRYGRKRTIGPGFAGVVIFMLALSVTAFRHMSFAWYVGIFLTDVFFQSLCSGSSQTIGADVAPAEARGRFLGMWQFVNLTGNGLSPVLFALIAGSAGYGWSFIFVAACALAVVALLVTKVPETGQARARLGLNGPPRPRTA